VTRRIAGGVLTALAALAVIAALVGPDDIGHLSPGGFVRLPLEALIGAAVLLALRGRARRVAAVAGGVLLGLLAILKAVDVGFSAVLDRPFDLVLDWGLLGDATGVVADSLGRLGAIGTVIAAILLVAMVLALTTLSVLRLTRLAAGHPTAAVRTIAGLAVVWVACAVLGTPVASRSTAALVGDRAGQVREGLHDERDFKTQADVDPYEKTPADQLLTGLRGKDVVISFVESYGRSAVEDPHFAGPVDAVLDAGTRKLKAAGFGSRSAFLTSSTVGGGSWLAHATLLSGLWINNQQRYRSLVSGNRLTLSSAFGRAGWRTVSVEPSIDSPWPEGRFYGYDKAYDSRNLEYQGPRFSYATMPDQYTFAEFQRAERPPGHAPVMAEITLVSSHSPWTPLPRMVPWEDVGDGTIYATPAARQGGPASAILGSPGKLRPAYRQSIEYSLSALISYVQKYGDDDLVLVFLGDHQPAPVITGAGASRDVPITIVAKDPAVLDRISGWGWVDGLNPGPQAPVWPMNDFRDRFLTAFGTPGSAH
jgi:hypothetical protein